MVRQELLAFHVSELKDALVIIEAQIQSGQSTHGAMEDFKVTIDNARNAVMAIVDAARSKNYRKSIATFHVQRANTLARNVLSDVLLGVVTSESPPWLEFQQTANRALEKLDIISGGALDLLAPAK